MKNRVVICGISGSIGKQAFDILDDLSLELVGYSFNKNLDSIIPIQDKYPKALIYSPSFVEVSSVGSFAELLDEANPDIVLNALVGFSGLEVTIECIKRGIDIALANKESFVVAGWLINDLLKTSNTKIFPIDSEHSSLYTLISNIDKNKIKNIFLTASGGPFFKKKLNKLNNVNFEDAVKHPNWSMGYKISIDSSTMINKCFEIIECFYLYNIRNICAIRHKESYVHSIVQFNDNSYHFAVSVPDMKLSIQQGLSKFLNNFEIIDEINFHKFKMSYELIDENRWLPIKWARIFLLTENKALPIIINAANEEAIELFKIKKIKYLDIINIIEKNIKRFFQLKVSNLKDIYFLDWLVRYHIRKETEKW